MTVKRVVLIRPGETEWNRNGRWQGWVAVPLNEHGRRQADALANYLRNIGMSALYTSDLKRALETAERLAETLGFEAVVDARLRERNMGLWQGLTLDEMRTWYPEQFELLMSDRENFRIPSGETRNEVRTRVLTAFDEILRADRGETIGILSHTTAIKILIAELVPEFDPSSVDLANSAVTTIRRRDDGTWQLSAVNDLLHLEGLEAASMPNLGDQR
ncbi:MAG: histidine phosphatase family protein [Chloroflexi bacterium]|nr:histidine phosphatase family protein [Chloroflexota bacterium]